MDEAQFLGYLVMAIITLGAFMLVIQRMTQPINDLKVVIQELRDCISSIKEDNAAQNKRIEEHDKAIGKLNEEMTKAIGKLNEEMTKVQTKINLYHGNH